MPVLFALFLGLTAAGGAIFAYRFEEKRLPTKHGRFDGREALSPDDIYERYFAGTGMPRERVVAVWLEIAQLLRLDAGKLRPSDRFDSELAPVEGHLVEDELSDIEDLLHRRFGRKYRECLPESMDDLVRLLLQESVSDS